MSSQGEDEAETYSKYIPDDANEVDIERSKTDLVEGEVRLTPQVIEAEKKIEKHTLDRIWAMIRQHPLHLVAGLLGAAIFGAVFPVWGLILAQTQDMFYEENTDNMRRESITVAIYFILMGIVSVISSGFQFWGVASVAERVSLRLRSEFFEAIMRR